MLKEIIDLEPAYDAYRPYCGELAALGIIKGQPFNPDDRMRKILEKAAVVANSQMRVQSFADRRPDRLAWPDRKWEWATLRPENGTFDAPTYVDLTAREKWFYQAQVESPAMFRRSSGAGSLYWLGTRGADGAFLDGGKYYKLTVPLPVPASLFWSVTVYDSETRSEIDSGQGTLHYALFSNSRTLAALRPHCNLARRHPPVAMPIGSRRSPERAGSPISTSMDLVHRPLMGPGSLVTSINRHREAPTMAGDFRTQSGYYGSPGEGIRIGDDSGDSVPS